jgi:hypothetical protein
VRSSPNFPGARLLLGQIHLAQKNMAAAITDLDAYLGFGLNGPLDAKVRQARAQAAEALAAMKNAPGAGNTVAGSTTPADLH